MVMVLNGFKILIYLVLTG